MLENFIYAKQKSLFEEALNNGEVLDEAIVFIEDTKEIWNHGTYFDGSKVDLSGYHTKEEIVAELVNYAKISAIPTKVSQLTNDSNYATVSAVSAKQDVISDLETIRQGASKGETAIQPSSLSAVATSGSYNDLTDKPSVIPVEQGGTGATTKESACDNIGAAKQYYMQKGLSKEGWYRIGLLTAVMSTSSARIVVGGTNADVSPIIMDFQHNFRGDMLSQMPTVMTPLYVTKVRACKLNSDDMYIDVYFTNIASSMTTVSVFPLEGTFEPMDFADVTNESVSVATVIDVVKDGFLSDRATTEALNDKQDKVLKFTNKTASLWVSDNTYADYPYRCDVPCDGVTAEMYAEVVFDVEHSTSGNYAPICETKANVVSVWSSEDTTITIPTIIITK